MMKLELLSSQILLVIGILSQIDGIYAAIRPPLATTTSRPRTERATVAINGTTTAGLPTRGTVAIGEPSPATTTPQPPDEIAMITTNGVKPTDQTTGSPTTIGTVEQPSSATATTTPPAGSTAEIIAVTTDAVSTPNEEVNVTGTSDHEAPTTIIPVESNNTNAATSDSEEGNNITSTTTPFEANSTESDDLNITTTARSPAITAETTPDHEEINSTVTDVTATDEFVKTTDISTIISSDEGTETATLSDTTSEPQSSTSIQSNQPFLTGITLTGLIITITMVGATLLIICVIVSVTIMVRIRRQKIQDRRERKNEIDEGDFVTVYDYIPQSAFSYSITRNAAYSTGQPRYSSRPSIHGGAVLTRTNRPKPLLPPRRCGRLNNQKMEVSIDSQGYIRLPRPFV